MLWPCPPCAVRGVTQVPCLTQVDTAGGHKAHDSVAVSLPYLHDGGPPCTYQLMRPVVASSLPAGPDDHVVGARAEVGAEPVVAGGREAARHGHSPDQYPGGMGLWYGPDGQPIEVHEAERLLGSWDARRVAQTAITTSEGQIRISTVFLVLDHGWAGGDPVLWETMTFGGPDDGACRRYCSKADAEAGHTEAVSFCLTALDAEGTSVISTEHLGPTDCP
jgi:hypothetical protein